LHFHRKTLAFFILYGVIIYSLCFSSQGLSGDKGVNFAMRTGMIGRIPLVNKISPAGQLPPNESPDSSNLPAAQIPPRPRPGLNYSLLIARHI
jgi:hypothetical protein